MFNEKVNLNGTSGRVKLKEIRERKEGGGVGRKSEREKKYEFKEPRTKLRDRISEGMRRG